MVSLEISDRARSQVHQVKLLHGVTMGEKSNKDYGELDHLVLDQKGE